MVYQIFNDGIESSSASKKFKIKQQKKPGGHSKTSTKSSWPASAANLLIAVIKIVLAIYDLVSLPVYFILQRPDRRAKESQRTRSQQVDANTWIRTGDLRENGFNGARSSSSSSSGGRRTWGRSKKDAKPRPKFMGSTMSEVFTNAVREFHAMSCIGYRAVVTCPMFTQNEAGVHVLEEKSFRSDYTWYTFGQIGRRVQDIASGLYYHSVYPTSRAMFMAGTCLEWFCTAQACFQLAIELVLVPDINDAKTLELILIDSEVQVLFVTCDQLEKLCKLLNFIADRANNEKNDPLRPPTSSTASHAQAISLKRIIVIDWQFSIDFDEFQFQQLRKSIEYCPAHIELLSIGQIEEAGIENPIQLRCSSAISEENLSPDQGGLCDPLKQDKSRYFNFSSNSNGLQSTKRRKVSGTSDTEDGWREAACSSGKGSRRFRPASAPPRRRHQASETTVVAHQPDDLQGSGNRLSSNSSNLSGIDSSKAPRPEDLALIVYTYGSLGQLKPIMLTHNQLARSSGQMFLDGMIGGQDVHCTILSLDNVIEFMIEICVFSHGGSIGYSCNLQTYFYDGTDLFARDKSDLEALKPTFLLVRPYILERLRNSTQNYLQAEMNPIASFVFKNVLYDYKKYWARRHFGTPIIDRLFCAKLRRLFGSHIKYILCNGATDCSETKDFFAFMANLPVIELYGPDEAVVSLTSVRDAWDYKRRSKAKPSSSGGGGGGSSSGSSSSNRKKSGHGWRLFQFDLGGKNQEALIDDDDDDDNAESQEEDFQNIRLMPPTINRNIYRENLSRNILIISSILCPTQGTRIRLEDWAEFRLSDRPYPRGRLVIGGDVVCKGYLKRPMLTSETFHTDSNFVNWFRTDDIARAFPNGSFEIISAISDMIKMVDGQFISLSQIELLIRSSQFVDNVCAICGEDRTFVINLVVPNLRRLALKSMGQKDLEMAIAMEPEPEELADVEFRREVCNDRLLCEFLSDHLNDLLARSGLSSINNRFLLVPEIWTPESELVTPAFKPKRSAIQKFYANDIQAIVRLEFGISTSRRLSARRQARTVPGSASPSARNHHLQLSFRSSGGSLSSVKSI